MSNKISFQFDDSLDYQLDAINSVVKLFDGLPQKVSGIYEKATRVKKLMEGDPVRNTELVTGTRLLDNLREIQLENNLFADDEIFGNNFTVEMETGTGKTYVYLRTILELYKEYDFKKFMIVVPSIAIRMGVQKSIEMLTEHFKALYNIDLSKHSFVYDSGNPQKVSSSFVETNELSICVLNIQAFNRDSNKIRTEDEYGQILWEDIKYIRPIVIIDEPQKVEGTKTQKSQSLKAIEDIYPLFTLRYSATHKQLYNQVYKLDSFAAYKQELVKGIRVKTVHGVMPKDFPYVRYMDFTSDLKAKIEIFSQEQGKSIKPQTFKVRGNASLYDLSGKLPQYQDMRIAADPHKLRPLQIATKQGLQEISMGQSTYEITENEAIRIQIRLAIDSHFEKQAKILRKGKQIKVLTLFFVDSVSKVRDNASSDGRGEYLRIFDEEYEKAVNGEKLKNLFKKYSRQMNLFATPDQIKLVREGYFAVDKKLKEVDIDENKILAKSQEDIDRGIELILEKKDELISFDEPLAFIFSHSALREGWDNPNVFTLCTLKHGGSEIAKKQEIGRGLRLPVDIFGKRHKDADLNELTVIANDYYEHFAAALQKDFNDSMNFNKDEVTADIIVATFKSAGIPSDKITPQLIDKFKEELFLNNLVNGNNVLTKDADKIIEKVEFSNDTLKEHSAMIMKAFKEKMIEKGTHKITVGNGDIEPVENGVCSYVSEDTFLKIFNSLSEKLAMRTIYKLELDKDEFIQATIDEINYIFQYKKFKTQYEVESGSGEFHDTGKFGMTESKIKVLNDYSMDNIQEKSDFELTNYIMYHTNLPRFAILKILWGIENKILLSNQDLLDLATRRIVYKLNEAKANSIRSYEVINGYQFDTKTIFEADNIDDDMLQEVKKVYQTNETSRRALNKFYRTDSEGEYDFAESLDDDPNVELFTKLKKGGFVINTPYGNYSPDWAVVYRENDALKLYFIVETKFEKEWKDLTDVEQLKIKCGTLHFKAINEITADSIKFNWANSYEHFKQQFGVEK